MFPQQPQSAFSTGEWRDQQNAQPEQVDPYGMRQRPQRPMPQAMPPQPQGNPMSQEAMIQRAQQQPQQMPASIAASYGMPMAQPSQPPQENSQMRGQNPYGLRPPPQHGMDQQHQGYGGQRWGGASMGAQSLGQPASFAETEPGQVPKAEPSRQPAPGRPSPRTF